MFYLLFEPILNDSLFYVLCFAHKSEIFAHEKWFSDQKNSSNCVSNNKTKKNTKKPNRIVHRPNTRTNSETIHICCAPEKYIHERNIAFACTYVCMRAYVAKSVAHCRVVLFILQVEFFFMLFHIILFNTASLSLSLSFYFGRHSNIHTV